MAILPSKGDVLDCFQTRLIIALKEKNWWTGVAHAAARKLDEETNGSLPEKSVLTWLEGKYFPQYPRLILLADVLDKSIDWLLCRERNPIASIAGETFVELRSNLIKGAQHTLKFQFHTGTIYMYSALPVILAPVMEAHTELSVQLLLCAPEEPLTKLLAVRRPDNDKTPSDMAADIKATISRINRSLKDTLDRIEVRTVRYIPSAITYIADDDTDVGRALTVMSNFRENFYKAPMIYASKSDNAEVFNFFHAEFTRLWEFGEIWRPENDVP